ncbi:hypothetical protein FA15DRAFT_662990 [Coprinopsis marcescibilis]|uniref:PB1 domain-containing protein n=1 Tax=Coprinopsis marcescibilis TaxID=230819 RepID=A0A5C3LFI0_COPMA|nr:hypothetical protein FA15DRAFT_662990 [Coprinopsis marcescibilis]
MSFNFKVKLGEETRRLTFPQLPTWHILAAKLQALYGIPMDNIAVSYLDSENDEITMSSEEELNDYYSLFEARSQSFKLDVHDLSSLRDRTAATSTPKVSIGLFDLDEDWQRLPSFRGVPEATFLRAASTSAVGRAFVEEVDNLNSTKTAERPLDCSSDNGASTISPYVDKGKAKEGSTTSGTSVQSVLDEEPQVKHEIHVMNQSVSFTEVPNGGTTMDSRPDKLDTTSQAPHPVEDPTDPPLPSINDPALGHSTISLANDLASLMSTLTNAATNNPELSTSFQRIIQNTSSGAYWTAHRTALAQQVDELSGSIGATTEEFRRRAEEEAARRVFTALGGLVRTFSYQPAQQTNAQSNSNLFQPPDIEPSATAPNQSSTLHTSPTPPRIPNLAESSPRVSTTSFQPPPPPPLKRESVPSGDAVTGVDPVVSSFPPPPKGPSRFGTSLSRRPSNGQTGDIWDPESRPSWLPPPPPPIVDQPLQSSEQLNASRMSPQELRENVEAAKRRYKEEKERYRKEREERKRQRSVGRMTSGSGPESTPAPHFQPSISQDSAPSGSEAKLNRPASVLVSNARGPFPRLEMDSTPYYRETRVVGHTPSSVDTNQRARAHSRIIRKLADMGFTESSYPSLPGAVGARISSGGHVSKEDEDDVVTTLLEDLLASAPKAPTTPASLVQGSSLPGGWQ